MIFGELAGKKLMVLSGRFHYYEGRTLAEIVYPVHVVDALGVKVLIVTNAAGGINPQFNPGDLMIIEDHINLMGVNPLLGMNDNGGGEVRGHEPGVLRRGCVKNWMPLPKNCR